MAARRKVERKAPNKLDGLPRFEATTRKAWRAWLDEHHASAAGVWLITYKKGASRPQLPYADVVEEALCYGWIDSKPMKVDEERTALLYTPRKPKSAWSASNRERVARLLEAGVIEPAGLRAIEIAKANGSWEALMSSDALVMPDDLADALEQRPPARAHWDGFPRGVRKAILEWINFAKRPETRAMRVLETATLAQKNERANQWKPKG